MKSKLKHNLGRTILSQHRKLPSSVSSSYTSHLSVNYQSSSHQLFPWPIPSIISSGATRRCASLARALHARTTSGSPARVSFSHCIYSRAALVAGVICRRCSLRCLAAFPNCAALCATQVSSTGRNSVG